VGKFSSFISEVGKAVLQMHGHRVVHLGSDAFFLKESLQFIAGSDANDLVIEDVAIGNHGGKNDGQASLRKKPIVAFGITLPSGGPVVEVR